MSMQERASAGVERPFAVQQGQGRDGDGALAEAEGAHFPPHRADDQRSQSAGRGDIQLDSAMGIGQKMIQEFTRFCHRMS